MNIAKLLEYYWPGCLWELVGNDQTDYKNLTWLDKSTTKPTESELLAKKDEGELREALDEIRPFLEKDGSRYGLYAKDSELDVIAAPYEGYDFSGWGSC